MKTKLRILTLLAAGALCPTISAQEPSPDGVVTGSKSGFKITAPEGWVSDNKSGAADGFTCVLYPKGQSWANARTAMYANMAGSEFEGVNAFVEIAISEMAPTHGMPKQRILSGKTKDGHDYFVNEYPATKTYSQWERVGYIQLPEGVAFIVLTSRDRASYEKDCGALEKVLKTLVYVEPQTGAPSGREFAHRYRQLLDQHAEQQIEPLLTEWREKAPDDPQAWITSANYYFNQRQTTISQKNAGPGDFQLTDQKTGKPVGAISFEPDKSSIERATDLLTEATSKFPDSLGIWCGLAFLYQESGDFENELVTLRKMVTYAREHPAKLQWEGKPLSEPADQFLSGKLHDYGSYYHNKESAEDDKRWFQISTLAIEQYPNLVEGYGDATQYYANHQEWKKAREMLEKVHQLNPKSVGALMNLGNISVEMKDFSTARKYYEEVLKLEPSGQYAQAAKEGLRKLGKNRRN